MPFAMPPPATELPQKKGLLGSSQDTPAPCTPPIPPPAQRYKHVFGQAPKVRRDAAITEPCTSLLFENNASTRVQWAIRSRRSSLQTLRPRTTRSAGQSSPNRAGGKNNSLHSAAVSTRTRPCALVL
eukprot:384113-Rhodomonas_salina.2